MTQLSRASLWQRITSRWLHILRIYWIPLCASVITTILGIIMTTARGEDVAWSSHAFLTSVLATCIFGAVAILNQDRVRTPLRTTSRYLLATLPLAYFVYAANYFPLYSTATGITFALLIASSVFFLVCSAELRRESTAATVWQFGLRSISIAILATAVGTIGLIAASLAVFSIQLLFQVPMPSDVYASIAVIMYAFVAPFLVIASAPYVRDVSRDPQSGFSPLLLRLVHIVFSPILIAYFLILYAYLLKIVFQWELPQESVVLPVLVYTIVGIGTYALVDPWRRANTHHTFRILQRGILFSFMPLLVLYGIAIVDRIREYGVTEARYLCALFGVWLFVVSLAFLLRKNMSLRVIPITLSILFLVAAMPGAGATAFTVRSQQNQLLALLQHPLESSTRIASLNTLLADRNGLHDIATALGLPAGSTDSAVFSAVQHAAGLDTWPSTEPLASRFEYSLPLDVIPVQGFDEIYEVTSWPSPTVFPRAVVRFNGDGKTLTFEAKGLEAVAVPLTHVPTTQRPYYEASNDAVRVRVLPTHTTGKKSEDGTVAAFHYLQLRVLVAYKHQP